MRRLSEISRKSKPVFVDRDLNACLNILLIGTSEKRPSVFCRNKRKSEVVSESSVRKKTKLNPTVDAAGISKCLTSENFSDVFVIEY